MAYSKWNNEESQDDVAVEQRDKLLNEFQVRRFILYCKYVDNSSEFQRNVSDTENKTLLDKLIYRHIVCLFFLKP